MGVFIHNDITDRGRILLGEAQVGGTFEATKIVMGSGFIPSGYTARTMTGVVAPVIELAINKKKRAGDGTVTFGGVFSNKTLAESFYFREFALYARVKRADGTYSDEVCYTYGNAGDNADLLPGYSVGDVVEKQMDLVTYIGNDTKVNLTIDSELYIPFKEKGAQGGVAALDEDGVLALSHRSKILTNEDLNDIIADGYYRAMVSQECKNVPDDVTAFGLLVLRIGENMDTGGNCNQILVPYGSVGNIIYTRVVTEGVWENWRRLAVLGGNIVNEVRTNLGYRIKNTDTNGATDFVAGNGYSIMRYMDEYDDVNNYREIMVVGSKASPTIKDAVRLYTVHNGQADVYNIHHDGNAPAVTATAELI